MSPSILRILCPTEYFYLTPWENGYIESFNEKLRAELLNLEIFDTLLEAKILIERWRRGYNQIRPHSSLGINRQHRRLDGFRHR